MQQLNSRENLLNAVDEKRAALDRNIATAGDHIEESGAFEEVSFKDLIADLTGWRIVTVTRLEAGLSDTESEFPWPDHLIKGDDDLYNIAR